MKPILFSTVLILSLLIIESCNSKKSPQTPQDITASKLKSTTWNISAVTADGTDQTQLFAGMTLSFSQNEYTTNNGGALWPSNGGWTFTDDTASFILRSDGITVTIKETTTDKLVLSLLSTKTTIGGGRTNSITGNYVFSFTK